MGKYLVNRIIRAILSVIVVVGIIMFMIYSLLNRDLVFAQDDVFTKQNNNAKQAYKYQKWEDFGYLDYVPYSDYLTQLNLSGELDDATYDEAVKFGRTEAADSATVKEYVDKFRTEYEGKGYTVVRLDAVTSGKRIVDGGQQRIFAYKDKPLFGRIINYFRNLITVQNIHDVEDEIGERGITFTWNDPVYGGEKFSPAVIGNGTLNKYLIYCDGKFPFIHQNMITINLGTSYSVNTGVDVFHTMTRTQGSYVKSSITYPTGLTEDSADDLHTATYQSGSLELNVVNADRFVDNYTNVATVKSGKSKIGYSFTMGIIATIAAYLIGVPLGVTMARKKDKLVDKIGTAYIVFIIAVPSLAYIFLFKAVGGSMGLPTTFDMESTSKLMYVLPIISLSLPMVANHMKWLRRYMIDQMNSDYVKFARSGGLTENEIFTKHILKNAIIPIVHGIPGALLGAMTGAIITERVYVVPGAGNLLTQAINMYDNGVIVGVALFYAILNVTAVIMGDILMSMVDPRISYTSKAR